MTVDELKIKAFELRTQLDSINNQVIQLNKQAEPIINAYNEIYKQIIEEQKTKKPALEVVK
jgi:hypothetical protein